MRPANNMEDLVDAGALPPVYSTEASGAPSSPRRGEGPGRPSASSRVQAWSPDLLAPPHEGAGSPQQQQRRTSEGRSGHEPTPVVRGGSKSALAVVVARDEGPKRAHGWGWRREEEEDVDSISQTESGSREVSSSYFSTTNNGSLFNSSNNSSRGATGGRRTSMSIAARSPGMSPRDARSSMAPSMHPNMHHHHHHESLLEVWWDRAVDWAYARMGKARPPKIRHGKRRCLRLSPRERQGLAFLVCEALLIAAVALQLLSFQRWMHSMQLQQVEGEVRLLDLTFSLKLMHMSYGFRGQAVNPSIVQLLRDGGGTLSERQQVAATLSAEINNRQIEFATLLSADGRILVSANKNRTGESWDPTGRLVSRVIAGAGSVRQVRSTSLLSYADLMAERPPQWRSRALDTQMTSFTHLYDTRSTGLVSYVATAVVSSSSPSSLLGVLVSGDLTSGKTTSVFEAIRGLGSGFAGIYHRDTGDPSGFARACSITQAKLVSGGSVLSAEEDPVPRTLLQEALSDGSGSVHTVQTRAHILAAKRADNGQVDGAEDPQDTTPAVIVRGLSIQDNTITTRVTRRNLIYLAVVVLVNLVALYISLSTFVLPLERLANKLKQNIGVKVDLSAELKGNRVRYYMARAVFTTLVSLAVCVLMYWELEEGLRHYLQDKATSALGVGRVAYDIKTDQMGLGFRGLATNSAVRSFLDAQNDTALLNSTTASLAAQLSLRKIEMAYLLNSSLQIIASGNGAHSPILGRHFNPDGMAAAAFRTGLTYKHTTIMSYDEYMAEHRPVWEEKLGSSTPDSHLCPSMAVGQPVVVRMVAAPVHSFHDPSGKPVGVLVSGGALNGKTVMQERVLKVVGTGYSAVYMKRPDGGGYQLVTSAMRSFGSPGTLAVDVPAPTAVLDKVVAAQGWPKTAEGKILGKTYMLAATRVPYNRVMTVDGDRDEFVYERWPSAEEPRVFIIFGKERAETKRQEVLQTLWSLLCALVQLGTTIYLNWMAYRPMQKLVSVLEGRGFISAKRRSEARGWRRFLDIRAMLSGRRSTALVASSAAQPSSPEPTSPQAAVSNPLAI